MRLPGTLWEIEVAEGMGFEVFQFCSYIMLYLRLYSGFSHIFSHTAIRLLWHFLGLVWTRPAKA